MSDKSDRIASDVPAFDAAMRKLVQVPKRAVERAEKRKAKKGKA